MIPYKGSLWKAKRNFSDVHEGEIFLVIDINVFSNITKNKVIKNIEGKSRNIVSGTWWIDNRFYDNDKYMEEL